MILPEIKKENCIWESLSAETRPIVLYGTGNGADKIIDTLAKYKKKPDAVFASSEFVRNRVFRDLPVRTYEDVVAEYGNDIVILLAFGSVLPEIAARVRKLAKKHSLLIPEVPLYESELFTYEYYEAHKDELKAVGNMLENDGSQELFSDMILFRLTGKPEYLQRTETFADSVMRMPNAARIKSALDAGAYIGDTTAVFAALPNCQLVYALEPDPKTFKKLAAYAENESGCHIVPINAAAYDEVKTIEFESTGGRGAGNKGTGKRAKTTSVSALTVDSIVADVDIDLLKFDVEGDEARALDGAAKTIERCHPSLIVSLYHRTEDLFSLPMRIHKMLPDAKLLLRRVPCIPAWDISLIAISE